MNLRCKPGDLAVVVRSQYTPELIGRFVIVERLLVPPYKIGNTEYQMWHHRNDPATFPWQVRSAVDGELLPCRSWCRDHGMVLYRPVQDEDLRPIRPGEGSDETMTWKRREREQPV